MNRRNRSAEELSLFFYLFFTPSLSIISTVFLSCNSGRGASGYDTNAIIDVTLEAGMKVVIPPKKLRKEQREYGNQIYKLRHLVDDFD